MSNEKVLSDLQNEITKCRRELKATIKDAILEREIALSKIDDEGVRRSAAENTNMIGFIRIE